MLTASGSDARAGGVVIIGGLRGNARAGHPLRSGGMDESSEATDCYRGPRYRRALGLSPRGSPWQR